MVYSISNPRLEARSISAGYRRKEVLHNISFSLPAGVHGLLGPNGAGKSTLFSVLSGVRKPTSGNVLITDETDSVGNSGVGYLPQRFDIVGGMTVQQHVEYAAWVSGVADALCEDAASEAIGLVGLTDWAGKRAKELSGGQQQRLGIACAVSHSPKVLLLDEPTVGLDPIQRTDIRRHLARIGEHSVVLVSTHLVEDLTQIADSVLVMLEGRIVFQGTLAGLAQCGTTGDEYTTPVESGYRALVQNNGLNI